MAAGQHRRTKRPSTDVPPYEPQPTKRNITPGEHPNTTTRELPKVTPPSKGRAKPQAPSSRPDKSFAPKTYESQSHAARQRVARGASAGLSGAANRAALSGGAGGKPSVAGHAAKGALGGAAAGAEVGTAVGGPAGTAIGAAGGAAVGAAGGAVAGHKAKKAWRAAMREETRIPRQILVAEFILCTFIVTFAGMGKASDDPKRWMRQMTAVFLLFAGLGMVTAAGRGAAKVSAAFGGVIALSMLLSQANLINHVAGLIGGGQIASVQKVPALSASNGSPIPMNPNPGTWRMGL